MSPNIRSDTWEKYRVVWVNSDHIEHSMGEYYSQRADAVGISSSRGYKRKDVSFLADYKDVTGVINNTEPGISCAPLIGLAGLKILAFRESPSELNLNAFPKLEYALITCGKNVTGLGGNRRLKSLGLQGYKPKTKDLQEVATNDTLKELSLTKSDITSLAGLAALIKLTKLDVSYCSKLTDIGEFMRMKEIPITELEMQNCIHVRNHACVSAVENLRILRMIKCGIMDQVDFVADMRNLEQFVFAGTEVKSGNLQALTRLKYCYFTKQGRYTHTLDNSNRVIMK